MEEYIKEYITQMFKLAVGDYKLARTKEDRQEALREMASLTNLAATECGFDLADELEALAQRETGCGDRTT